MRVWNAKARKLDFSLGGHTASVNVVRWGGEGVIYTASSDRTVKLWDGKDVSRRRALDHVIARGASHGSIGVARAKGSQTHASLTACRAS